jgi:hypothetical protein
VCIYICMYVCMYVWIYMYVCMYVFLCVCVWEREREICKKNMFLNNFKMNLYDFKTGWIMKCFIYFHYLCFTSIMIN